MQKLQHEQGLTYLFIAHDLSMVKYISDRIGVMHWGKLLEVGPADEIYHNPIHPYTKSLLSAIPEPDPERERKRQHLIYDSSIEMMGKIDKCMKSDQGILFMLQKQRLKIIKKKPSLIKL